jgi:hypothetical protein
MERRERICVKNPAMVGFVQEKPVILASITHILVVENVVLRGNMDLKVGDYVSFNYSRSFYIGKIVKEEPSQFIVKCTVGKNLHTCNFFNSDCGLWLYKSLAGFSNVKKISKSDYIGLSIEKA